ncbi:MAG: TonB-dependent receptor domain-containing protein [Cytophagaceae bacterium]
MKNFTKLLNSAGLTIALVLFSQMAFAQTGILKGIITDEDSNEPLIDVNISIPSLKKGTLTELDGDFMIQGIPAGRHRVIINAVGYLSDTVMVNITSGNATTLNHKMRSDEKQVVNIVVYGEKPTSTEAAVVQEIREAEQVVVGISSQQIEKTQDNVASDVVKRIPGVTVMQDKFIMVRGLSERYNTVMLHGVFAPSMEADVKSFSFDILPSAMIDRILIYKSPTPDLPGDFAGGLIKVYTKSIPDSSSITLGTSVNYREGTHLRTFKNIRTHWSGFNDGNLDLPDDFANDVRSIRNLNALESESAKLPNRWVPDQSGAGLDYRFNVLAQTKMNIGKYTLGNITAITHQNKKTRFDIIRKDFNSYNFEEERSTPIYRFEDEQFSENILSGILHNWALRFNPRHIIEFKNLFTQIGQSQYVDRGGEHLEFGFFPSNHSFQHLYRGVYSGQLLGRHEFSDRTKFDWVVGYGRSYRDIPDYRRYRSDVDTSNRAANPTLYIPTGAAQFFFLGRFFSKMVENTVSANTNITHELELGNFKPIIGTGVFFERKDRDFTARNLGYVRGSFMNFDQELTQVPIDSLFHPDNINGNTGILLDEQTNPNDSYQAGTNLLATYLSLNLPISEKVRIITGARIESYNQTLESATTGGQLVSVDTTFINILPSVNSTYNITDKMLIRAAYGMTLNRAEFREIAPFSFFDFDFNLVRQGDPNLKPATIHNMDLRWELYPSGGEMITFGAFYKYFDNPIEVMFLPGGGSGGIKSFSYGNARSATSMGIELDARKSLAGVTDAPFLQDLGILLNAAYISSKVNVGDNIFAQRQSQERPMQGQSPYIINTGLFYQNVKNQVQANLMYNIIGRRIFVVGFDEYPDIYEMPRHQLDFTISKNITKNLELRAGVRDILNNPMILMQDGNQDGVFDRENDQIIQSFRPGRVYTIGLTFRR